ncbi:hypothetical protein EC950183_5757, partial [Escherichia coli 95.0183]
MSASFRKSKE